jgi:hypothetical protein
MNKITASPIGKFAIEFLEKQIYQYIYAPSIAPDLPVRERTQTYDMPEGKY